MAVKNTNRRPDTVRLGPWHQRTVYGATALLSLSGAVWLVLHFFMVRPGEFGETHHPLETWMLKVHGAAARVNHLRLAASHSHPPHLGDPPQYFPWHRAGRVHAVADDYGLSSLLRGW